MKETYEFETFTCPSCSMKIEGTLKKLKGIENFEVLFNSSRVKVEFDEDTITSDEILETIESLGFKSL